MSKETTWRQPQTFGLKVYSGATIPFHPVPSRSHLLRPTLHQRLHQPLANEAKPSGDHASLRDLNDIPTQKSKQTTQQVVVFTCALQSWVASRAEQSCGCPS